MKKVLLPLVSLLLSLGVSAAPVQKSVAGKLVTRPMIKTTKPMIKPMTAEEEMDVISFNTQVVSVYDADSYDIPNYYIILATNTDAKYDNKTGTVSAPANTITLILDLYNDIETEGALIPSGTYKWFDDDFDAPTSFGYSANFSMVDVYDPEFEEGRESTLLTEDVEVVRDENGNYTISTVLDVDGDKVLLQYNGPITLKSANDRGTVFPQINYDVDANLNKGGLAIYQGVTDYSNNGVTALNLYDVEFDRETGAMKTAGTNLCLMYAHKRFVKKADYTLVEGEYTNATSLERDTWYPGREIDYMGITVPFGSYLRQIKVTNGEAYYVYAYLKEGTFTIEKNDDGTWKGTLDAISTEGRKITAVWSGDVTLDPNQATWPVTVSDLKDDVYMNFDKLEKGRIYHAGLKGGCRTLIVDLGSPSGKDEAVWDNGDLLRMEFLVDRNDHLLHPGIYTVVPRRWNDDELRAGGMYEPMSLNKGYFANGGDQVGTRYAHTREGSYMVYDMVGPAEEGTVEVETDDFENYTFHINLKDDAGFIMAGEWVEKPLEYCYDPEALQEMIMGIEDIATDEADAIKAVVEGESIMVINAGNAEVTMFDIYGRQILTTTADKLIPTADLAKGIYVINVKNTSIKVAL